MTPKLTNEMRQAIRQNPGRPISVEDDETHKIYVLVDQSTHERAMRALAHEEEDLAAVQAGLDAAATGEVSPLDEADQRIRDRLGFPPRR
jgi:predicted transcriptional regulator